jgi:hypothetical protein
MTAVHKGEIVFSQTQAESLRLAIDAGEICPLSRASQSFGTYLEGDDCCSCRDISPATSGIVAGIVAGLIAACIGGA